MSLSELLYNNHYVIVYFCFLTYWNIRLSYVSCQLSEIKPVRIVNVRYCVKYEKTFNYLIKEYHYLSYGRPVGQNMKYIIIGRNERILGCLLFGAAAWKTEGRDQWIGWSPDVREKNLGLICNNTRFLILDWINLESSVK